jgi:lipopolysaccharide/colanic/teichoic acid biosynthesis glycosyltransferase
MTDIFNSVHSHDSFSRTSPRWKRALDLLLISVSFPLFLPLMLLVSTWIKLVSCGPVFYRQQRVGRHGKLFHIFKFRSMKLNVETRIHDEHLTDLIASDAPMTKLDKAGDDRLIFLGRLIRAVALDELPQIFNVIRGEMSLVGPRPCTPHEYQYYRNPQRKRFEIAPGLTGYWQVHGKNRTTFTQMMTMDRLYAQKMSPMLDLTILLKTGPALLAQALAGA